MADVDRHKTGMQQQSSHSKRFSSRVETPGNVYVYWSSVGYDDTSRVRDLSSGGLFVQTKKSRAVGAKTNVHFLVEEGQIRAEAVVRHVRPGRGLGLEFMAVQDKGSHGLAEFTKSLLGEWLVLLFSARIV